MKNEKKISFCITCMNRLSHIQHTLARNIEDNFLPDDVEFVLLDYNSSDGLEEWVKTLQKYIDIGILHYYRIETPECYHRSHSRNVAFRLASGEIVCNLDADNFLGKGFAEYAIKQFADATDRMFITSTLSVRDIFGRFCSLRSDFLKIRGYNELLAGYGAEDTDLYKRLNDIGLRQAVFENKEFCNVVKHSNNARVTNEHYWQSLRAFYVAYNTPYNNSFILLKNDFTCEYGQLVDNPRFYVNATTQYANELGRNHDRKNRIVVENLRTGVWNEDRHNIHLQLGENQSQFSICDEAIIINDHIYYKISKDEILSMFIMYLSTAVNYEEAQKIIESRRVVNPSGFGQGTVYGNFDRANPTILI